MKDSIWQSVRRLYGTVPSQVQRSNCDKSSFEEARLDKRCKDVIDESTNIVSVIYLKNCEAKERGIDKEGTDKNEKGKFRIPSWNRNTGYDLWQQPHAPEACLYHSDKGTIDYPQNN